MRFKSVTKKSKKKPKKLYVVLKKCIPLQCFNKQMIVLQIKKSKENEEISFDVRSYRSYLFRILW